MLQTVQAFQDSFPTNENKLKQLKHFKFPIALNHYFNPFSNNVPPPVF